MLERQVTRVVERVAARAARGLPGLFTGYVGVICRDSETPVIVVEAHPFPLPNGNGWLQPIPLLAVRCDTGTHRAARHSCFREARRSLRNVLHPAAAGRVDVRDALLQGSELQKQEAHQIRRDPGLLGLFLSGEIAKHTVSSGTKPPSLHQVHLILGNRIMYHQHACFVAVLKCRQCRGFHLVSCMQFHATCSMYFHICLLVWPLVGVLCILWFSQIKLYPYLQLWVRSLLKNFME